MLCIQNLTVSYNKIPAIHHLSLKITEGVIVGLFGPNGAGKSSLLKAIAGLISIESGQITICEKSGQKAQHLVSYLPQHECVNWDFPITVKQVVELGRYHFIRLWKKFSDKDESVVCNSLLLFDLVQLANRPVKDLSGGEQKRTFLARAWAQESFLYLLDEPFAGLDEKNKKTLLEALIKLKINKKIILVSHHQLEEAKQIFDQVILINGELIAYGDVESTLSQRNIECTYCTAIYSGKK